MSLLEIKSCSFGYGLGRHFTPIVKEVSFAVESGDFLMLLGANGCGKSTILKGILGLAESSGAIQFSCHHKEIGYVPQESHIAIDTPATALDIVSMAMPHFWGKKKEQALSVLDRVGLIDKATHKFGHLSGGQKRRVLLARALMNTPKLLIMDEPTAFADAESINAIEQIVQELCASKEVGVIASTHSSVWAKNAKTLNVEALHG